MSVQIYDYNSYQSFLRDFVDEKRASKKLSFRYFSRKCGFKRPNYFQSIVSGERKLTLKSAQAVAKGLNLNHLEQEYFEQLVRLAESEDDPTKSVIEERLDRLRRIALSAIVGGVNSFDIYLLPVIWEMFQLEHIPFWTAASIRESLTLARVSHSDIEKSLQKLEGYGFIASVAERGFRKVKDAVFLGPTEEATETGMRECHRLALRHAAQALVLDVKEREMQNLVVAIRQSDLPHIKNRIRDFLADLNRELTGLPHVDRVVQIHLSVVPLSTQHR